MAEHPKMTSEGSPSPSNTPAPKRLVKLVYKALVVSFVVHLIALLIFGGLIILKKSLPEEVTFEAPPPTIRVDPKKRQYKLRVKQQMKRSSRPQLQPRMQSTRMAEIALPTLDAKINPIKSKAPKLPGMANAFGEGLNFSEGSGNGNSTMFGILGRGSLQGYLYDLKRDGTGKPRTIFANASGIENVQKSYDAFMPHLHTLDRFGYSDLALSKHMRVGESLSFNVLAIPTMTATIGPKAFGAEGKMKPLNWLAIYKGKVQVKNRYGEEIRLLGRFDDILMVYHKGKIVLDGSWDIGSSIASKWRPYKEVPKHPLFRQPYRIGRWFKMRTGDELIIVVGEVPGGALGGGLFC